MMIWRVPVTELAQFHPFYWVNTHAQTLLDIENECTGCICEDGLTGTVGMGLKNPRTVVSGDY